MSVPIEHHIAALKIAVYDIMFMRVRDSLGDFDAVFDYMVERKSDVGGDGTRKNLPVNKLHDNSSLA